MSSCKAGRIEQCEAGRGAASQGSMRSSSGRAVRGRVEFKRAVREGTWQAGGLEHHKAGRELARLSRAAHSGG